MSARLGRASTRKISVERSVVLEHAIDDAQDFVHAHAHGGVGRHALGTAARV